MTNTIKEQIKTLYENGYGYKRIAKELKISVGSVRNILAKDSGDNCRNCGKKLFFIEGKKKKIFCNDSCRYQYWNNQRRLGTRHGN